MDKLSAIKKRYSHMKIQTENLPGFPFRIVSYDPLMLCDDMQWLIDQIESARERREEG